MLNTQYVTLSMIPSGVMPVLYCSQYDVGRPLGFVVNNGSEVVNLDQYMVAIEGTRSDGTGIVADVNTDGNIGVFLTTATMTNKSDIYDMQLVIRSTDTHRVASIPFMMNVRTAALDENSSVIEEDKSLFQQYTETVMIALAEIRTDVESEATARGNADSALLEKINIEAADRAAEDTALNDRIDNIIAPGGAPSEAEVTDARLGADGVLYDTLGEAIRTQFDDVYKNLAYTVNLESDPTTGLLVVDGGIGGTVPTSLTATLEPQQTGSGAPSADNIRPFVQFTSLSMLHAGESGGGGSGNPPVTPFFGGTQNCITGEWTLYQYNSNYSGITDMTGVRWWSDRDVYVAGTNPSVGAYVVYEPSTPMRSSGQAWGAEAMYPGINQYKMLAYDSVTQTQAAFTLNIETDVANVGDVIDGIADDVNTLQSDMNQTNQALTLLRNEYDITASTVVTHTTLIENNTEDIAENTADIAENAQDISLLKSHLDEIATYNLFDPNDPTYRAGCYIDGSGNVVQASGYFVSNHIHAAPGMTFVATYASATGLTNVRAYNKNGTRIGNVTGTLSSDGKYTLFTVQFADVDYITVNGRTELTEYMIIRSSEYPNVYIPDVALNKSVQLVLTEDYQKLSEENTNINNALGMVYKGEQSVTTSVALQGHFVNATNDRVDAAISFNITNSIALEKGQIISITAQGYNNVVGMICIYESDTDKYKTVVRSEDSTVRTYTYTATERCNVRISYDKTYTPVVKIITAETHSAVLEELIDNLNVQNIEYPQLFDNILCIGDSLTVGYDGSGDTPLEKNYPHFLEKLTDANTTLKARGGWTAKQIWDGEISTATDLANYDCAIIFLGTNGGLTDTVSTDCKADYTQNADTNTGCYGKIIGKIKAVAPNCKIFCVAGVNDYIRRATTMNPAVRALAEFYSVGLIDVENCIMSDSGSATSAERYLYRPVDGIHYNALGYMTLANMFYDSASAYMGKHRSMYA